MSLAIFVEYVIVPYAHNVRCIRSNFTQHDPFLSTATQSCVLAGGKHWAIPGLWRPYVPGVFFLYNSARSMVEYTTYISSRHLRCLGYNPGIRHMWNAHFVFAHRDFGLQVLLSWKASSIVAMHSYVSNYDVWSLRCCDLYYENVCTVHVLYVFFTLGLLV